MSIKRLLVATSNEGKLREVRHKLAIPGLEIVSPASLGITTFAEEDAPTLEGNARKKAEHLFHETGLPTLADDTGLEVSALDGRPGVLSARYAGPEEDAEANCRLLLSDMMTIEDRSARFRTVLAFVDGKSVRYFEGSCEGYILKQKQGDKGFGYDPLFRPASSDRSFAEMTLEEKNAVSHRARALSRFATFLESYV